MDRIHGISGDKGFTGLANLENTCFLNSCLQVLSHTYELTIFLNSEKCSQVKKKDLSDTIILNEWNDLRTLMWSNNGAVSPNKFVYSVQQIARQKEKDIFTGWAQNDMSEFLLFMIDCIHTSVSRRISMKISGNPLNKNDEIARKCYEMLRTVYSKEYSEIMDIFYGIYVTNICSIDNSTTHVLRPEHYFVLDLQVFTGSRVCTTIYDCFDLFVTPEIMSGENAWFNEKTNEKEEIRKTIHFFSFPKILVVVLKRFSPDGSQKINNLIDFPLQNLDLSKYVRGYNKQSYLYDLYGVCNHMGGVTGGHYTAYVKNITGVWIHYNDTSVEIIPNPQMVVSPMAYCLFYRKKNL